MTPRPATLCVKGEVARNKVHIKLPEKLENAQYLNLSSFLRNCCASLLTSNGSSILKKKLNSG